MAYHGTEQEHESAQNLLNSLYNDLDHAAFQDNSLYMPAENFSLTDFSFATEDNNSIKDVFGKDEHNYVDVSLGMESGADGKETPVLTVSVYYEDENGNPGYDEVSVEAQDMYDYVNSRDGREVETSENGVEITAYINSEDGYTDVYDSRFTDENGNEMLVETKLEPNEDGNGQDWVTRTYEQEDNGFENTWAEHGDEKRCFSGENPMENHIEAIKEAGPESIDQKEQDISNDSTDRSGKEGNVDSSSSDDDSDGQKDNDGSKDERPSVNISAIEDFVKSGDIKGLVSYLDHCGIDSTESERDLVDTDPNKPDTDVAPPDDPKISEPEVAVPDSKPEDQSDTEPKDIEGHKEEDGQDRDSTENVESPDSYNDSREETKQISSDDVSAEQPYSNTYDNLVDGMGSIIDDEINGFSDSKNETASSDEDNDADHMENSEDSQWDINKESDQPDNDADTASDDGDWDSLDDMDASW